MLGYFVVYSMGLCWDVITPWDRTASRTLIFEGYTIYVVSCINLVTLKSGIVRVLFFCLCPALHYPFDMEFFLECHVNISQPIVNEVSLFIYGYESKKQ